MCFMFKNNLYKFVHLQYVKISSVYGCLGLCVPLCYCLCTNYNIYFCKIWGGGSPWLWVLSHTVRWVEYTISCSAHLLLLLSPLQSARCPLHHDRPAYWSQRHGEGLPDSGQVETAHNILSKWNIFVLHTAQYSATKKKAIKALKSLLLLFS